jgi:N6-L-threonylcarbamoyladenine synthase
LAYDARHNMQRDDLINLGIETSCDETSAALYCPNQGIISLQTFTQIPLHTLFGGVVPELASKSQLEKIHVVVQETFKQAELSPDKISSVAVTTHPGLPGSLSVGISFAKGFSLAIQKPIIGVNHLEGHIFSPFLNHPSIPFPHLCLTASGGHTSIHYVKDFGIYELINYTLDDAAGEAFDKVAKLMNLPYPGGPILETLAKEVYFEDFFHFPRSKKTNPFFSFSGVKTAVLYTLIRIGAYNQEQKRFLQDDNTVLKQQIASSLIRCVTDIFIQKLKAALALYPHTKAITFAGGVACNLFIQETIKAFTEKNKLSFFVPSKKFCTDNGAMIAFVGNYKTQKKEFDSLFIDRHN